MKPLLVMIAAMSLSSLWQQVTRPTNSDAAVARGVSAYNRQRYEDAAREFAAASRNAATPQGAFNLGTAEVAAGRRAEGSAALAGALADPRLRADALFNRGNSALAAKAYEHAVRDYTDSLKVRPSDPAAKRNLEIALRSLEAMRKQEAGSGGQQQQPQQGQVPQQQSQDQQQGRNPQDRPGQGADPEALLRSVQQQEQEELARMKRARGDSRRVGW